MLYFSSPVFSSPQDKGCHEQEYRHYQWFGKDTLYKIIKEKTHKYTKIVSSLDLGFYVSQTARGEMLAGAHIDPQPSYSSRSGAHFLSDLSHSVITLLPFMRDLRILRQWTGSCDMSADYSPIMGHTDVEGLLVTTGWGTWGFKAIPAGGEAMAELIATGETPELIAPFALSRFKHDRTMADPTSTGTH